MKKFISIALLTLAAVQFGSDMLEPTIDDASSRTETAMVEMGL